MKKESDELLALKQKLAAAEKENARLRLKNEGLEIMINIAEKQFDIPIRKKSGPKQ
jgi:regulator of replication initiation timing